MGKQERTKENEVKENNSKILLDGEERTCPDEDCESN